MSILATRPAIPRAGVGAIVIANAVWAIASLVVLAAGSFSPTTVGGVWIVLQAIVVACFAVLQSYAQRVGAPAP